MKEFFESYPHIFKSCNKVKNSISCQIPALSKNEISFDLILPFLIEELKYKEAELMSYELCVHREIVDCYNNGIADVDHLLLLLNKKFQLSTVTYEQYQKINKISRKYNGDLLNSYLKSVERVYYRLKLVDIINADQNRKIQIMNQVEKFSAFLLFDDDVYDFETDILAGKKTILTEYINGGNSLDSGIDQMLKLIDGGSTIFEKFTNSFKLLYNKT